MEKVSLTSLWQNAALSQNMFCTMGLKTIYSSSKLRILFYNVNFFMIFKQLSKSISPNELFTELMLESVSKWLSESVPMTQGTAMSP